MNNKTFNSKEFVYYAIPVMAIDLLIHVLVFIQESRWFIYWDPLDVIMKRPRTLYFVIVGYLIAVSVIPISFFKRGTDLKYLVKNSLSQTLLAIFILSLSIFVLFDSFPGRFYLQQGILTFVLVTIWHILFKISILKTRGKGRNQQHVVIIGNDENALSLYKTLNNNKGREYNDYKFLGFFADDLSVIPKDAKVLGSVENANDYLSTNKVHIVYCSINPAKNEAEVNSIIRICEECFIDFYYVPDMDGYLKRRMIFSDFGGTTVVKLREEPLSNPVNYSIKRAFDILISFIFLITVFPIVFIFVAIGTKISSPGPVFFVQKRTGYKGKSFNMYKFRSMKVNVDSDKIQATKNDPRKTPFGDFLRRTSIDELPQFINILIGDMSIIGPRPHMEYHTKIYNKLVNEYMVRHMIRPGLTGWAQVNGCRGETKDVSQMAERVRCDIWYIENWSVLLDIKILLMTILQVLKGDSQAY